MNEDAKTVVDHDRRRQQEYEGGIPVCIKDGGGYDQPDASGPGLSCAQNKVTKQRYREKQKQKYGRVKKHYRNRVLPFSIEAFNVQAHRRYRFNSTIFCAISPTFENASISAVLNLIPNLLSTATMKTM